MRLAPRAAGALAGLLACLLAACGQPPARPAAPAQAAATAALPREGYIHVPGGRIWYARMGDGPGTPLVVIHGGPGSASYGLKVWGALGDERPVIRYDQLGAGKADHPTDTTLFTVARAVRELQALRDSLGLSEVHLYGRSWGAMVVEAYMGTHPAGVRSVILSSPLVTTAQWERDADSLVRTLPDSMQRAIARHEAAGTTNSAEYRAAMAAYYARYVRRLPPRSPADADSAAHPGGDLVYSYMWGPSEFAATGTLKHFDGTAWLREIRVPTLFLAGEHDEATPASTARFARLVPGAEFRVIPGSGHATENDNPDALLATVRDFLHRVERR
ncbi:MAG TPA: proline iminopeptidase-family hydrolase [Longimicrobiales bacterium]|nr:proline iminopeptidase-family hydrolase [Longimicrobiales bacterium]